MSQVTLRNDQLSSFNVYQRRILKLSEKAIKIRLPFPTTFL